MFHIIMWWYITMSKCDTRGFFLGGYGSGSIMLLYPINTEYSHRHIDCWLQREWDSNTVKPQEKKTLLLLWLQHYLNILTLKISKGSLFILLTNQTGRHCETLWGQTKNRYEQINRQTDRNRAPLPGPVTGGELDECFKFQPAALLTHHRVTL